MVNINDLGNINTNKMPKITSNSGQNMILMIIVAVCVVILVIFIIVRIVQNYKSESNSSPFIIDGTHNASSKPLKVMGYKIKPSFDKKYGIEFTYSMWLFISSNSFENNTGWKHVFHKGNSSAMPLQAPGVWIYPTQNKMSIVMNTFNEVKNSCDVGNLPLNKWFLLTISCISNKMDVYINGELKKRCDLDGIPKQNYGDLYVTRWGGFNGYISNMRYYNYALPYYLIEQNFKEGPSKKPCEEDGTKPPYLAPNWWMNTGFPNGNMQ
jgi:hypothetical protein